MPFILLLTFLLFVPSLAHAGFEWLPPSKNPAPITAPNAQENLQNSAILYPSMDTPKQTKIDPYPLNNTIKSTPAIPTAEAPLQQNMAQTARILTPVQLGNNQSTNASRPLQSHARTTSRVSRYIDTASAGQIPSMAPVTSQSAPAYTQQNFAPNDYSPFKIIDGFGNNIPLHIALSQIIPGEYKTNFSSSVDKGMLISWQGGQPWAKILEDILRENNLSGVIDGDQVLVKAY